MIEKQCLYCENSNIIARNMCWKHYQRSRRAGNFNYKKFGSPVNYETIHRRLRKYRGRASEHACIDCGSCAAHWSLNLNDNIVWEKRYKKFMPFSLNLDNYSPRCRSCHKLYDNKNMPEYDQ